jgi:hypothetical protein
MIVTATWWIPIGVVTACMYFYSSDREVRHGWFHGKTDLTIGHARALAADRARPCARNGEQNPLFGFTEQTSCSADSNQAAFQYDHPCSNSVVLSIC